MRAFLLMMAICGSASTAVPGTAVVTLQCAGPNSDYTDTSNLTSALASLLDGTDTDVTISMREIMVNKPCVADPNTQTVGDCLAGTGGTFPSSEIIATITLSITPVLANTKLETLIGTAALATSALAVQVETDPSFDVPRYPPPPPSPSAPPAPPSPAAPPLVWYEEPVALVGMICGVLFFIIVVVGCLMFRISYKKLGRAHQLVTRLSRTSVGQAVTRMSQSMSSKRLVAPAPN